MKGAVESSPENTGLEQASLTRVSLSGYLDGLLAQALAVCGFPAEPARIVRAGRPECGELQCNAAFPLAKRLKRRPDDIAMELAAKLGEGGDLEDVEVAGG